MSIYRYAFPRQGKSKLKQDDAEKEGKSVAQIAFRVANTNSFSLKAGFWVKQN